ncbi:hypothetical protein [Patiriisocius hiemis]|uniref:Uncharacterized protein n=1 Tax=Patiriisocius hiemis TaxID=3075604 RepID=A0ABU2YDF0_9FLAO|nr:hypothetical protein [Constantimarinum sp. W242]MDT0556216.1 hypothetical protein [Constantimarinum sp. W242]
MKDLETIHWELVHAVATDMFFYIIADNTEVVSYLFDIPMESYLNKVIYFKEGLEIAIVDEKETFQKVINKKNHLESNLLKLTSIRDELKEENFKIVLDRHMQWANMSCFYSNLLLDNVDKLMTENVELLVRMFEIQRNAFVKYSTTIKDIFKYQELKPFDVFDVPSFSEGYSFLEAIAENKPLVATETQPAVATGNTNTEKEQLITDKEAERFLLKTVFHIKQ